MSTLPPPDPTQADPPPSEPPAQTPRRLLRSRTDRVVAGVAGGAGRYFGVDPVLVRIALLVLLVFGGAGALLYLAAVLLVPTEGEGAAAQGATDAPGAPARNRGLVILGIVALCLVAGPLLLGPALLTGGLLVPLGFLVLAGLVVAWLVTGERPTRDAGSLLRATLLGLGVLLLCWLLAAVAFWATAAGGEVVVAGVVIAAGVALVAAAFVRPARWLILPAIAVAIPAAFVAASGLELDGGIGERTYRPASAAAVQERYELGIGELVVDLRDADLPAGDRRLDLELGMGEVFVVVPDDVCVGIDVRLGAGDVDLFGRDAGGVDVAFTEAPAAPAGATRLLVDADIGFGALKITHEDPNDGLFDEDGFDGFDRLGARNGAAACA